MNDEKFCSYCGARNDEKNKFCESCGQLIDRTEMNSSMNTDSSTEIYQTSTVQNYRTSMSGSYHALPDYNDPNQQGRRSGIPSIAKFLLGLVFFFIPFLFILFFFILPNFFSF